MLGVKDIAFKHFFLADTDLASMAGENNISKKIQKWSDSVCREWREGKGKWRCSSREPLII